VSLILFKTPSPDRDIKRIFTKSNKTNMNNKDDRISVLGENHGTITGEKNIIRND